MSDVSVDVRVRLLEPGEESRWDAYVDSCPDATFFHRAGWKQVIERAFKHAGYYLLAEEDDQIRGVLPLVHTKSWLFGDALVSTPFCVYGGVAGDDDAVRRYLEDKAAELAIELQVDYLELRNLGRFRPDWPGKKLYVTFRKAIDPDPDRNILAIPRKQRAMVRKGIQAGLYGEVEAGIESFYAAYSESVRNLGTPVLPKRYFALLREVFNDDCEVLTIRKDGRTVSSVMSFYFRDEVLPYYGGGVPSARRVKANDFMYWELMRRACLRGVRIFDYGRSKEGTGSYAFKKNWGFEPEPLHYQYKLVTMDSVPEIHPLNPRYRLLVEIWKRLPLAVANGLGPMVARNLG